MHRRLRCTLLFAIAFLSAGAAHAEFQLNWGGMVQSDIRLRVQDVSALSWYNRFDAPAGVSRNMNLVKMRVDAQWGRVKAVADVDLLWLGVDTDVHVFSDLFERMNVDPLRLKAHAAYADIYDFIITGLDLRIGQQLIEWGVGDTVNPTNVINANDFEDPLLFGHQLANSMLRVDYAFTRDWSMSLVGVPVFKPAVLNPVSLLAAADPSRMPFQQESFRLLGLANAAYSGQTANFPYVDNAVLALPDFAFDNIQWAARIAGTILGQDVALSYYYGRVDQPQLHQINTTQTVGQVCNPASPTQCIAGTVNNQLILDFPRFQMIGVNIAGEVPLVRLGYHVELGVFFPHLTQARLFHTQLNLGTEIPAGEEAYGLNGGFPTIYDASAFTKWNIGVDYIFPGNVFLGVQYIHGFVDEFGNGVVSRDGAVVGNALQCVLSAKPGQTCATENTRPRIADYLIITAQANFLADQLQAQLWLIWDMTGVSQHSWDAASNQRVVKTASPFDPKFASTIVTPSLTWFVGGGLEASLGLLAHLGSQQSKFGDPVEGAGTEVWSRVRYVF